MWSVKGCSRIRLILFFVFQNHKEAFLNEQYKEIEENDRMGMTRDLFKKVRDTKGIFSCGISAYSSANQPLNSRVIIVCKPLDQRLSDT